MNGKWFGKWLGMVGLVAAGALLFNLSSCARDQELVSISITPSTETFGASNIPVIDDAGLNVQLRALGSYIHPEVTKDITDKVTWASNTPQMVTVNSTGLITATGQACGGTIVSATVQTNTSVGGRSSSGAIVTGFMTANVVCFTGSGGGSGPIVTVNFLGSGSGTVTSSPAGLNCASTQGQCSFTFPSGTPVTLTATPIGTFGGWSGACDSISGETCTINSLTTDVIVTATFNP
jgi:hypothetical protein